MPKVTSGTQLGKTSVIVEIGADWLKMAQVEPSRGGPTISKLHLEKLAGGDQDVSAVVASAFTKGGFARVPVIAYLPRQMVNIRMLELPSTDPAEIADMVDLQSGKQTPYSKDEIVADYRIVGRSREGYTRIMLALVQRSAVRERFFILEEAGLDVARMSISSEGILNWFAHADAAPSAGGAAMLLDVDSFYSDFSVIGGGSLTFTRSILVGADQLLSEYEKWKEKLTAEIKQSIETCRGELPGLVPSRLIVTGAGARITDLVSHLGGELGVAVEARDAAAKLITLPATPSVEAPEFRAVSLTPLIGAALDRDRLYLNLVPESVKLRKELLVRATSLASVGLLTMALLVFASLYLTLKLSFKGARLAELRDRVALAHPAAREVERMQAVVEAATARSDTRSTAISVLSVLHPLVPADVFFAELAFDAATAQVVLEGSGKSRQDVSVLVNNLEGSPRFQAVVPEGQVRRDGKTGRYVFRIVCSLESKK